MTIEVIMIVLLVWLVIGIIIVRLSDRAGYVFGWYPENHLACRIVIIVQAPGAILDHAWQETWWALFRGGDWRPMIVPQVLWEIFKDPTLSVDDALYRRDERHRR